MTDDERRRFLTEEPRVATCSVVRRDGRPHATPIWFMLDGDDVIFTTARTSVKGPRDPPRGASGNPRP